MTRSEKHHMLLVIIGLVVLTAGWIVGDEWLRGMGVGCGLGVFLWSPFVGKGE